MKQIIEDWISQQKYNFAIHQISIHKIYDDHYRVDLYVSPENSFSPSLIKKSYVLEVKEDTVINRTR